jgi:hypothetical protein
MFAYLTDSVRRGSRRSGLSRLRRLLLKCLPVRRLGAVRTVFLTRRYVLKLPGWWTWAHRGWWWASFLRGVYTENLIRVDDVTESPKLAE